VRRGFFPSIGRFLCVWSGFSQAAGLSGVLRCIGVWFWWLYYIASVDSSVIYPAVVCARSMLALTSATPGMPYADVSALGISTSGRSLSQVKPTVGGVQSPVALRVHVRKHVALRMRVRTPPKRSTATPRGPRDSRRPALARDLFFLMQVLGRGEERRRGGELTGGREFGR
jgi:hypothetical protein